MGFMDLTGTVCASSNGDVAVIFKRVPDPRTGNFVYEGIGLSGKKWKSRRPRLLAKSLQEYIYLVTESRNPRKIQTKMPTIGEARKIK